ncbi:hypothetical protein EK904_004259 [Melospiza melodia maxima]|nr:hypothetical protein EK904_004259 [Melospiza melodia maxima]
MALMGKKAIEEGQEQESLGQKAFEAQLVILVMKVKEDLQLMAEMAFQVHLAQMVRKVFQVTPHMALQESQAPGDCQDPLVHREQGVIQAFLDFKDNLVPQDFQVPKALEAQKVM